MRTKLNMQWQITTFGKSVSCPTGETFLSSLVDTKKEVDSDDRQDPGIENDLVDPSNMKSTAFSGQMLGIMSSWRASLLFYINLQFERGETQKSISNNIEKF
jgi:hypothetical protein